VLGMLGARALIRQHVRRLNVNQGKGEIILWNCKNCGHENKEESVTCEFCGALRFDEIGDSLDNQDSEDLFFDDECL